MRRTSRLLSVVAAAVVVAGVLVPATGASATQSSETGPGAPIDGAAREKLEANVPDAAYARDIDTTGFTAFVTPSCSGPHYGCLGYMSAPSMGLEVTRRDMRGGVRVAWPSGWKEGQTVTDVQGWSVVQDLFGQWRWRPENARSFGPITRPYSVRSLSASVSSVNSGGRSAVLRGTATPTSEIRVGGTRIATTDTSGSWSGAVTGLRPGTNDLTVTQRIYDKDRDQRSVSVTVTDGISARVTSQDDDARTAQVSGTATPNAAIRVGGVQVATAGSNGAWSATLSGLSIGTNTRTFTQYVNGSSVDSTSLTITIKDPGLPDRIVGESGTSELVRGETGSVTATFTPKSPVGKASGSATFSAPRGTTFPAGQDALRGQVFRNGEWEDFDGDTLVRGKRANDGSSYEYTLADRDLGLAADQRFRWSLRVDVPAGLSASTGELSARLQGSVTAGTFDTTATTTTTFVDAKAPFSATATFPDDVAQRVVISGHGEAGARVDLSEGSKHVGAATVGDDGTWSLRLAAPNRGGVRELRAEQTIGTTPSGSVPVRIDYGTAVWIVSPGNGYQIQPVFPNVRVSGFATPRSQVVVTEEGTSTVLGTATAGADGRWAITTPRLQQRDYTLLATATGPGANVTSSTVTLVPSR